MGRKKKKAKKAKALKLALKSSKKVTIGGRGSTPQSIRKPKKKVKARVKPKSKDELSGFVLVRDGLIMSEDVTGDLLFLADSGFVDVKIFPTMGDAAAFLDKEIARELPEGSVPSVDWATAMIEPVKKMFTYDYDVVAKGNGFRLQDRIVLACHGGASKREALKFATDGAKADLKEIMADCKTAEKAIREAEKAVDRRVRDFEQAQKELNKARDRFEKFQEFVAKARSS